MSSYFVPYYITITIEIHLQKYGPERMHNIINANILYQYINTCSNIHIRCIFTMFTWKYFCFVLKVICKFTFRTNCFSQLSKQCFIWCYQKYIEMFENINEIKLDLEVIINLYIICILKQTVLAIIDFTTYISVCILI